MTTDTLALPASPDTDLIPARRSREPSIGRAIRLGVAVIALTFGGGLGWSLTASLDSAARAHGVVVVDGNRKTVQHLEGGILSELLVRDGDLVTAGQVLLRLEGTRSRADLEELAARHAAAAVKLARLRAEYAGDRAFRVPADFGGAAASPAARALLEQAIAVQQRVFAARWSAHDEAIAVLEEQRRQSERAIDSFLAQERSAVEQIAISREELAGIEELYRKGLERRTRLLSLMREQSGLAGSRDEARAKIAETGQALAVIDRQMQGKRQERRAEIAAALEETQAEMDQVRARLETARDAVARTELRAPVDGRVMGLTVFTAGGVIKPGEKILDIVPAHEVLTIEARVDPTDIDVVHAGQSAQVQLTAFKQRNTPSIDATLVDVSADRMTDPQTGAAYFTARVRPAPGAVERLGHVELHPGMPAEVMIATGRRRAIDYFIAPLRDAMNHSLIED